MKNSKLKTTLLSTVAVLAVAATVASTRPVVADNDGDHDRDDHVVNANQLKTVTPIKHLVVIFDENRSFDHYFGTYPNALNVEGEPRFEPAKHTPTDINNLLSNPALLDNNPNLNPANGMGASNPFRLDRTQANTADQSHNYTKEQLAYDGGLNDLFPLDVGRGTAGGAGAFGTTAQVMGYFDGNTVTALWNYAQNFAMSDNAFTDTFGPSTPGLLNMWSGQTNGATFPVNLPGLTPAQLLGFGIAVPSADGSLSLIQDIDPAGDICSNPSLQVLMTSKNIGDLLNAANIPWGSFYGGFNLQTINENGSTGCKFNNPGQTGGRSSMSEAFGATINDYVPHHIWGQYWASTANPTHARPSSVKAIGFTNIPGTTKKDPANHNYDLADFQTALDAGNFPAVNFIKFQAFQDGHPGNSDPLDEQTALVNLINKLQQQPDWKNTAVIITYDDSDGQYDHVAPAITSPSFSAADGANGAGNCGTPGATEPTGLSGQQVAGRCGPGFRIPFLVISPFAKKNFVSHTKITQASVTQFVEDNWLKGERLGSGSFDATTGSIMDMFDFHQGDHDRMVILNPNDGTVEKKSN